MINDKETNTQEVAQTQGLTGVGMAQYSSFAVQLDWTVTTPSPKTFLAGEAHITTITFDTKANTNDGDFVVVTDLNGLSWGVAADLTGSSAEPTNAVWVAIPAARKAQADISGATTAADVAAAFHTEFTGLTGFSTVITAVDVTDGTMTMTHVLIGPAEASVTEDAVGAIKASGTVTITSPANLLETTADTVEVAGVVFTAQADYATPGDGTFQAFAGHSTPSEGVDFLARTAASLAAQINAHATSGAVVVATSAADVVTIEALAAGTAGNSETLVYTDNGTSTVGATVSGSGTLESGTDDASSISVAETNTGVLSKVDITANTITIASHGYKVGLKGQLTSTATLPGGLSLATDYFVIVVDANTIKLATSLSNANAGTAINITDAGTDGATHTFTATSLAGGILKLQESADGSTWTDMADVAPESITATASKFLSYETKAAQVRPHITLTAGQVSLVGEWAKKG